MTEQRSMRVLDRVSGRDLELNVRAFMRHLRADNLDPITIEVYDDAARRLTAFLAERGMPLAAGHGQQPLPLPRAVLEVATRGPRAGRHPARDDVVIGDDWGVFRSNQYGTWRITE